MNLLLILLLPSLASASHSNCHTMRPVFDHDGNLRGYRSICTVDAEDPTTPLPPVLPAPVQAAVIDSNFNPYAPPAHTDPASPHRLRHRHYLLHKRSLMGGIFGPDPPDTFASTQFNWMSPTLPGLSVAHRVHRHCLHHRRKQLHDHVIMNPLSTPDHRHDDPYSLLPHGKHCLHPNHYGAPENDSYGLSLMHQITTTGPDDDELPDLHSRLHRHLDCHCHHHLPHSSRLNIHHHPLPDLSAEIYSHEDTLHGNFDPNTTELEANRLALLRMASGAADHAQSQGLFSQMNPDEQSLQMNVYHPYAAGAADSSSLQMEDWNKPQVEKVIVIKRLKVPIVTEKHIPRPYPVPVPVYAGDASKLFPTEIVTKPASVSGNPMASAPTGQVGMNTFLVDGGAGDLQTRHIMEQATGMSIPTPCDYTEYGIGMPGPGTRMSGMMNSMSSMMHGPMNPMMPGMMPTPVSPMNPMMSNPMNPMMHSPMNNMMPMNPMMNPMMQSPSPYSMSPYGGPGPQLYPSPSPYNPYYNPYDDDYDDSFGGKMTNNLKKRVAVRAIGALTGAAKSGALMDMAKKMAGAVGNNHVANSQAQPQAPATTPHPHSTVPAAVETTQPQAQPHVQPQVEAQPQEQAQPQQQAQPQAQLQQQVQS